MIKAICTQCQTGFLTYPSHIARTKNAFCSRNCYLAWRQERRSRVTCAQCGKVFCIVPAKIKELNFCDLACVSQWRHENWKGKDAPQYTGTRATTCEVCGKQFERIKKGQRRCSQRCRGKWQSQNRIGPNAAHWQGGKMTVKCAACGKPLERFRFQVETRSERFFCNAQCRGTWMSENMLGDKHPNWRGGWDYYYGPNWEKQRDKARERDYCTCQVCGLSKTDIGRNPDVHHIVPFREFGYVPTENDHYLRANHLENLITLCPSCHQKANWDLLTFQPKLL